MKKLTTFIYCMFLFLMCSIPTTAAAVDLNAVMAGEVNAAYTPADGDYSHAFPATLFVRLQAYHSITVLVNSERDIPHNCTVLYFNSNGTISGQEVSSEPGYYFTPYRDGLYAFVCYTAPGKTDLIGQIILYGT